MKTKILSIFGMLSMLLATVACSDNKSYADLLWDENKCVNSFLAQHRVMESFPGADNCETGSQAPYYRVDDEGNVYMQVLQKGNGTYPETGERVYFRYMRYDLNYYIVGSDDNVGAGNTDNMNTSPTYFLFNDFTIEQSSQYGTGIQKPVELLGYGCKVNVVIKSQSGPSGDMSYVVPYLYNISYNKPAM